MNEEPIKSDIVYKLEGLINLFMRVLALIFIWFATRYWLLMVGVLDAEIRFDTMLNHWKAASAFLSVSYPIAALGMWGLFRWGIVIWIITASIEIIMHVLYPQLYGQHDALVLFHLSSMGAWLLYFLIEYFDKKRALMQINK